MMATAPTDASLAMVSLVGLLALAALFAVRWLRARRPGRDEGEIRLVAVRSMGGKRLLALVEVENERFLVGMTDDRIACLGTIPRRASAAPVRPLPVALAEAR